MLHEVFSAAGVILSASPDLQHGRVTVDRSGNDRIDIRKLQHFACGFPDSPDAAGVRPVKQGDQPRARGKTFGAPLRIGQRARYRVRSDGAAKSAARKA